MLKAFFTSSRAKSFYWRTSDMAVVAFADFIMTGLTNGEITLPAWAVAVIGLALGELTKALNKKATS